MDLSTADMQNNIKHLDKLHLYLLCLQVKYLKNSQLPTHLAGLLLLVDAD